MDATTTGSITLAVTHQGRERKLVLYVTGGPGLYGVASHDAYDGRVDVRAESPEAAARIVRDRIQATLDAGKAPWQFDEAGL